MPLEDELPQSRVAEYRRKSDPKELDVFGAFKLHVFLIQILDGPFLACIENYNTNLQEYFVTTCIETEKFQTNVFQIFLKH